MKATWILVADSSRARIFSAETPSSDLFEIETLAHPEGRLHEQDMVSDLPGRDNGKAGAGGHAFQAETEPKEQETINFARRVARHLDEAHKNHEYEQLLLVSAPGFLGTLRHQLPEQVNRLVCFNLDKNLTTRSANEIRRHLPQYLPSM